MEIKDILLPLSSFPTPTGTPAIESAVALAASVGAHVSAMAFEMDIQLPIGALYVPADVRGVLAADRKTSAKNARGLVSSFATFAEQRGLSHDHAVVHCPPVQIPGRLAAAARLRDLSIVPIRDVPSEREIAERLVFESGRPVLIFPEEPDRKPAESADTVAVAWDASGPAARAVADAMPFLRRAKEVRFFTVVGEKPIKDAGLGDAVAKHLARHGVEAVMEDVKSRTRPIGQVFNAYVDEHDVDLLVMGAYGHSRLREFILGGATDAMLRRPPTRVLLSH